jgi:protocadherin-16/23
VEIQISDVNDNAPEFEAKEIKIWVPETAEQGSIIYSAIASDKDSGVNGEVSFYMVANAQGIFKLDRMKGLLTVQRSLDYEASKEYTVVIGARDNGNPQRKSQNLTLHIEIQDSNDNPPVWHKVTIPFQCY